MKLTAAIAASYFGAMVRTPDGDYRMHHVAPNLMCIEVETGNQFDYVAYDQCQLILTPLDKISDEDAVEVAKMFSWFNHYNGKEIEAYKNQFGKTVVSNKERIGKYETVCLDFDNPELLNRQQIDYLRSKGYDCGHGSIPNLIAAGVAVEKEIV